MEFLFTLALVLTSCVKTDAFAFDFPEKLGEVLGLLIAFYYNLLMNSQILFLLFLLYRFWNKICPRYFLLLFLTLKSQHIFAYEIHCPNTIM